MCLAQTEHKSLLEGTKAYQKGSFTEAEQIFRSAVEKNSNSLKGNYNLGNSLFKNKKYEEAEIYYQNAISNTESKSEKSLAFYNLGNSHLVSAKENIQHFGSTDLSKGEDSQKQLMKAIEAYKNALRNNSTDYDAKNNLATAYRLLRQQQQKNQNNKKNQKKDKNQKPQKPNKKDKPIENSNEEIDSEPEELKKDEVDRLMEIIEQEDKKVQKKLMKRKRPVAPSTENDW
jgi:Ca-activated chloride channel homolog